MGQRRKSRELTVQTLYGLQFIETDEYLSHLNWIDKFQNILDDLTLEDIEVDSSIYLLAAHFLQGLIPKIDTIDELIDKTTGEYKIEKLGLLELNILRLAVFEMVFDKTPPAIVIDEAVELTKKFCAEKSPSLVNAILDKVKESEVPDDV